MVNKEITDTPITSTENDKAEILFPIPIKSKMLFQRKLSFKPFNITGFINQCSDQGISWLI